MANVEIEFGDKTLGSAFASIERERDLGREKDMAREAREGNVNEDDASADGFGGGLGGDAGWCPDGDSGLFGSSSFSNDFL